MDKSNWNCINLERKIPCGNPEILVFPRGRQIFFIPRDNLVLPTIPRDRQKKEFFFVNFTLFLLNVMTIFSKNKRHGHPIDHIFQNPVEINA